MTMKLAVMATTERHGELVADLAAERSVLGKAQVMGVGGLRPHIERGCCATKRTCSITRMPRLRMRRWRCKDSSERIDDRNALHLAAMAHVFRIQLSAPKSTSGSDDGGIPIGQPMRSLDFQCASHNRH